MNFAPDQIPLLGWSRKQWEDWLTDQHCSPVHARPLIRGIHRHGEANPERIDSIPQTVRSALREQTECTLPDVVESSRAQDGTRKWLHCA